MTTDQNEKGYIWDEAIGNAFEDAGIGIEMLSAITAEQWSAVAADLNNHVENVRDFMPPTPSGAEIAAWEENRKIASLESENVDLRAQLEIFSTEVGHHFGGRYASAEKSTGKVMVHRR